jgi:hypothetical protein
MLQHSAKEQELKNHIATLQSSQLKKEKDFHRVTHPKGATSIYSTGLIHAKVELPSADMPASVCRRDEASGLHRPSNNNNPNCSLP